MVVLGAPTERGSRCGAAEAPILDVNGVAPYEPKQPVVANTSEQIGDLRWLTCGRHCARLGNEYRVAGQLAHGSDGRAEQGSELPGRLEVVAVDPYPLHIGTAGPPLGRSRGATAVRVVDDVD